MLTISKATAYNWKKLKSSSLGKLTTRANKTESVKHVKAYGYVDNEKANILLDTVSKLPFPIECIMFSLVISLLTGKQLIQ